MRHQPPIASTSRASLSNLCHPSPSRDSLSLFNYDLDPFAPDPVHPDPIQIPPLVADPSVPTKRMATEAEAMSVIPFHLLLPESLNRDEEEDDEDDHEERDDWVMPRAKRPRLHLSEDPSRSSTDSVTQESEPRLLYDLPSLCPAPLPLMSSLPIPEPPTVQLDIPMYSDQLPLLAFEVEVAASKLAKSPAKRGPRIKPANDPLARFRKARKGGRVGRLTQMLEGLPLELLTEILSHSTPSTLLRLSRVARVFRNFLLSRSSRSVWVHAFANDGLPSPFACSKFFNEPTYAALIWDKECALCGREKIHKCVYKLRKRVCEVCMRRSLHHKLVLIARHEGLHEMVWTCVPSTCRPAWYNLSTLPAHPLGTTPPTADANDWFMEEDVLLIGAKLWALEAEDMRDPRTSSHDNGESRVVKFVKECRERQTLVDFDSDMLTKWQANLDKGRSKEKKDYRTERIAEVRTRLLAEGVSEEDVAAASQPTSTVYVHMDQPYPLTQRVWRKIHPLILAHIEEIKVMREKQKVLAQQQATANIIAAAVIAANPPPPPPPPVPIAAPTPPPPQVAAPLPPPVASGVGLGSGMNIGSNSLTMGWRLPLGISNNTYGLMQIAPHSTRPPVSAPISSLAQYQPQSYFHTSSHYSLLPAPIQPPHIRFQQQQRLMMNLAPPLPPTSMPYQGDNRDLAALLAAVEDRTGVGASHIGGLGSLNRGPNNDPYFF